MMDCQLASCGNCTFNLQLTANWGQTAWIMASLESLRTRSGDQPFICPDKSSQIICIIAMVWCWQNDRGLCPLVPAKLVSVCWLNAGSVQQEQEWSPSTTAALSSNQNAACFCIIQSARSVLNSHPNSMKRASLFLGYINMSSLNLKYVFKRTDLDEIWMVNH